MSDYKHGVYGEKGSESNVVDTTQVTTPIYIGTAPIFRLDASKLANIKIFKNTDVAMALITSNKDVKNLNLMSDDWESYSLCEVFDVHFKHDKPIAPFIIITPLGKLAAETKSQSIALTKSGTSYIGYLDDAKATIDNMAISVASATLGTGDVSYGYDGDRIKIVITKENFNANSVEVSYRQIATSKMDVATFKKCLEIADRAESVTNRIPNILCAPQYSSEPQYHDLMMQKALEKIDEKWNLVVASDIGQSDGIAAAIAWKKTNSYNGVLEKVCFPKLGYAGKKYHMSVIWTAAVQNIDMEYDNIPCKSASNTAVFADSIISNIDDTVMYFSEAEANELNKNGIMTAITTKGQIRLWGSHMGNYDFENLSNIAIEDRFDVAVRMSAYIQNYLQYNHLDEIDESITRKDIDSIINSVQMWLDSLVNEGKLLYATVEFDADSDLANGDIVFHVNVTYPCVVKSITFKVIHTNKGLSVFTTTGEGVVA